MVASQTELIIETGPGKRLPPMLQERWIVIRGVLAAHGESYHTIGQLSARHIQRILVGAPAGDLPVEQVERFHFVIDLAAARVLGLPAALVWADEVIE